MSNCPRSDPAALWNAFHRALLEHVAADERLPVASQRVEVVEIDLGKHQLLVSLDGGSIKARMKFQGPDRDRPNMIRVMFLPADPLPYEIGGDTFSAVDAVRHVVASFVENTH